MMRKSIIILSSILILCTTAKATNCEDVIFQEEKIELSICSNYGRIGGRGYLLFEARTKVLNDYIKNKIARGKLEDKKFRVSIQDPIYIRYLSVGQDENGYFVNMSGLSWPTLEQLISIVNYFTKPDWEPISFSSWIRESETEEEREKRFQVGEQKISNLLNSEVEQIEYQHFIVWERDGVTVEFSGDSLRYTINGTLFPLPVALPLPVKIQDRYLFFQDESIVVVQDMEIIQTFDISKAPLEGNIRVNVYPKWVNITFSWTGRTDWAYSYSYDKNRLFVNPRWKYSHLTAVGNRYTYNDFLWRMDNHGGVMIVGYSGTNTEITIPSTINGMSVNGIDQSAFFEKNLTSVTIPNSVKLICVNAFRDNQLTNIVIPNSVVVIRSSAFSGNLLTNVTIPKGVTHIEPFTFGRNRLTNVTIPNSVVVIDYSAFENNHLQHIIIPASVREVDSWAFGNNPITGVTIGANVVLGSRILGRDTNFERAYNEGGKQAGIYTRPNTQSVQWTRKQTLLKIQNSN